MPPIPIVLTSSFLFLLACIIVLANNMPLDDKEVRGVRKRKKREPKSTRHGNMEESENYYCFPLQLGNNICFRVFPVPLMPIVLRCSFPFSLTRKAQFSKCKGTA
jgi:hypothetical protein